MEFEQIVGSRVWPVRRQASMHNWLEHPLVPEFYRQDKNGTDAVHRQQKHTEGGDTANYEKPDKSANLDLEDAAMWPGNSAKKKCFAPFVVAGLTLFWVVPSYLPEFGMGEAFLTSYAAGGLAYYLKYAGGPHPKKN